jgi:amino acid transporter
LDYPLTTNSQAMSIASFAYVGVEIVAASALEVQWPKTKGDGRVGTDMSRRSREALLVGKVVKFSATWIPILATVAYTFAGTLATLDISRVDPRLPRLSWLNWDSEAHHRGETTSVFVAIGQNAKSIPHLDDVFNTFLVFTAITCSNTNLYVASRALFGLTSRLDGGSTQPSRTLRILAWFGRTNDRKVPARAMWFSAFAFAWVPFLELKGGQGIGMVSSSF